MNDNASEKLTFYIFQRLLFNFVSRMHRSSTSGSSRHKIVAIVPGFSRTKLSETGQSCSFNCNMKTSVHLLNPHYTQTVQHRESHNIIRSLPT